MWAPGLSIKTALLVTALCAAQSQAAAHDRRFPSAAEEELLMARSMGDGLVLPAPLLQPARRGINEILTKIKGWFTKGKVAKAGGDKWKQMDGMVKLGPGPGHWSRVIMLQDGHKMAVYAQNTEHNTVNILGDSKNHRKIVLTTQEDADEDFKNTVLVSEGTHDLDNPTVLQVGKGDDSYILVAARDHGKDGEDAEVRRITVFRAKYKDVKKGGTDVEWETSTVNENPAAANPNDAPDMWAPYLRMSLDGKKVLLTYTYRDGVAKDILLAESDDQGESWPRKATNLALHHKDLLIRDGSAAVVSTKDQARPLTFKRNKVAVAAYMSAQSNTLYPISFIDTSLAYDDDQKDFKYRETAYLPDASPKDPHTQKTAAGPQISVCKDGRLALAFMEHDMKPTQTNAKHEPIAETKDGNNFPNSYANSKVYAMFSAGVKNRRIEWSQPVLVAEAAMWPSVVCDDKNKVIFYSYTALTEGPVGVSFKMDK